MKVKRELTYLGHVVSEKGIKMDPLKTKAIVDMPDPIDKKRFAPF